LVSSAGLADAAYLRTVSKRLVEYKPESEYKSDVTIMMEAAFPPFNDYDDVDGLVGFDVELLPLICDAASIKCSVVTAPFKTAWPGHEKAFMGEGFLNHHFDCVAASGNTMPRRSTLKFSDPYTKEVLGAFVADKGTTMAPDGSDVHIGTVEGFSCGKAYLVRTMPKVKKVSVFPSTGELFKALSNGTVEVALTCPLASAKESMNEKKHEIIKTARHFNDGLGFMCHPEAADKIALLNSGLEKVRHNGELKKLCQEYPDVKCDFKRKFDAAAGGIADVRSSDVRSSDVTIMVEAAFPPFNDYDPVEGLVGFDVDLIPLVCDAAGIKCSVVTAPFKTAWPGHEKAFMGEGFLNHQFDCAAASGNTMPRRSTLKFSHPYTEEVLGAFVTHKGTSMAGDGRDVHIGVVEGFSCGRAYLQRTMPKAKKVTEFPSTGKLFDALSDGKVQVALTCPLASAKKSMDEEKHHIIQVARGFNDGLSFMCHPEMASKIALLNSGLDKVRENGELRALCKKYKSVRCDYKTRFGGNEGGVDDGDSTRSASVGHLVAATMAVILMMTF